MISVALKSWVRLARTRGISTPRASKCRGRPRLGVSAAFARVGKLDLDETEQSQVGGKVLDSVRRRESYCEPAAMPAPALGLGAQSREGDCQCGLRGRIRRELTQPQDAHRRSP